jgi:uncharacterized protein YwqG
MLKLVLLAPLVWLAFYGAVLVLAWLVGGCLRAFGVSFGKRPSERAAPPHHLRARLKRLSRPTLLLIPAKTPGFSKVGGLPELPIGIGWPHHEAGPCAFVAQIDLGAFSAHGGFEWLPEKGRIYLFFDDDRNGAPNCGRVIYTNEPAGQEATPPAALAKARRFGERRVGFMRFVSLPSEDWLGEQWPYGDADVEGWRLAQDAELGDEIEHRIGGYPSEIQGGQMAVECEYLWRGKTPDYREDVSDAIRRASRQWRLLLQIDSDPALGMNWWDAGRLYVFVRARDAKRGDFSKTVTITQTY